MAITTYSELKSAVADFLNRDDLSSVVPTFISLAEAGFNRDLRHWRSQRRVSTTCDEQYEDLPNDFISAKFLAIDTANGTKTLELASQAEISRRNLQNMNATGEPVVYTINSGEIEFVPAPIVTGKQWLRT